MGGLGNLTTPTVAFVPMQANFGQYDQLAKMKPHNILYIATLLTHLALCELPFEPS